MAKIIQINLETKGGETVEKAVGNFTRLKREVKAAKDELAGFDVGSKGFEQAQKKVAALSDELGDLQDAVKIQGTSIEKLNASFGLLKEAMVNLDPDKLALALQGLSMSMAALPMMALTVGITLLIENFDKLKGLVIDTRDALELEKKTLTDLIATTERYGKVLDANNEFLAAEIEAKNAIVEGLKKEGKNRNEIVQSLTDAEKLKQQQFKNDLERNEAEKKLAEEKLDLARQDLSFFTNQLSDRQKQYKDYSKEEKERYEEIGKTVADAQTAIQVAEINKQTLLKKSGTSQQVYGNTVKNVNEEILKNDTEKNKTLTKNANDAELERQKLWSVAYKRRLMDEDAEKSSIEEISKMKKESIAEVAQVENTALVSSGQLGNEQFKVEQRIGKSTLELKLADLESQKQIELQKVGNVKSSALAREQIEKEYAAKVKEVTDKSLADSITSTANKISSMVSQVGGIISSFIALNREQVDANMTRMTNANSLALQNLQYNRDVSLQDLQVKTDAESQILDDQRERALSRENLTASQKEKINKEYDKKKKAQDFAAAKQQAEIQRKSALDEYAIKLAQYNSETELKKAAFEQDKKARIAQTIIGSITGSIAALNAGIQAFGLPYGAIVGGLMGAAITELGFAAVNNIKKQQFISGVPPAAPVLPPIPKEESSGGNSPGGDSAVVNRRTLFSTGASQTLTLNANQNGSSAPIKAYLLTSEVSSNLELEKAIESKSSY